MAYGVFGAFWGFGAAGREGVAAWVLAGIAESGLLRLDAVFNNNLPTTPRPYYPNANKARAFATAVQVLLTFNADAELIVRTTPP